MAGMLGSLGGAVLNKVISANIQEMARQFIVGENTKEAVKNIERLRKEGFAAVVDVLGEATLTVQEAEEYVATYLEVLESLKKEQSGWKGLPGNGGDSSLDWGHAPKVNVAVKPTALFLLQEPQEKSMGQSWKIFEKHRDKQERWKRPRDFASKTELKIELG